MGIFDGAEDGMLLGTPEGIRLGIMEGIQLGIMVGAEVGAGGSTDRVNLIHINKMKNAAQKVNRIENPILAYL